MPGLHAVFIKLILLIDILGTFCDISLWWVPKNHIDDKSTLVQVMAWCRQATSHYLSQCWLRSVLPDLFLTLSSTQHLVFWASFTSFKPDTVPCLVISCTAPGWSITTTKHINWELTWLSLYHTEHREQIEAQAVMFLRHGKIKLY